MCPTQKVNGITTGETSKYVARSLVSFAITYSNWDEVCKLKLLDTYFPVDCGRGTAIYEILKLIRITLGKVDMI